MFVKKMIKSTINDRKGMRSENRETKDRMDNSGKTIVDVIVAVVIFVVIVGGTYYALRRVSGQLGSTATETESSEKKVAAIGEKLTKMIAGSDVDIVYDYTRNGAVMVSVRGFAIAYMENGSLYIYEEAFRDPNAMTDDEKIAAAKEKLTTCRGSLFTSGVVTFILDDSTKKRGEVSLSIRVEAGDGNSSYETMTAEVHPFVQKRANGETFERVPVITPEVTKPGETPEEPGAESPEEKPEEPGAEAPGETPEEPDAESPEEKPEEPTVETPGEAIKEPLGPDIVFENGMAAIRVETLMTEKGDSVLEIVLLCEERKAGPGWCVGGIGFGSVEVSEKEQFQYLIGENAPVLGKKYLMVLPVADIVNEAKSQNADIVYVNFYNGFCVEGITLR